MEHDRFFDNTRISGYRGCPRKFYFRHVMHWAGEGWSPPLTFGSSWHAAMDTVWTASQDDYFSKEDVIKGGYAAFVDCWMDDGAPDPAEMGPEELDRLGARTPMNALEMPFDYVDERWDFLKRIDVLEIEKPFAVPLDPNDETLFYVGRLDKVFEMDGGVYVGEHKTTSLYAVNGGFRSNFLDSFSPNSQVDGYLHALHMLYGEQAKAVWIDAALVHKKHHDIFKFIPIERQIDQLDSWLWDTHQWIEQIERDWSADVDSSAPFMGAFRKNTDSCQDFARNCPYMMMCKAWPNPIGKPVPEGFEVNRWSPFERLELEKIGLEADDE